MENEFLYDISRDFEINHRKARLLETKKRFRHDISKQESSKICLKNTKPQGKKRSSELSLSIVHNRKSKNYYLVSRRLGDRDSMDGEAYEICKPEPKRFYNEKTDLYVLYCNRYKTYIQAVKVVPLTIEEANNINDSKYSTWREIKMLKQATELVLKEHSPNLPMYYTYSICDQSMKEDYDNINILKHFENSENVSQLDLLLKEINRIHKDLHGIKQYRELKQNLNTIYQKYLYDFTQGIDLDKRYSNKSVLIFNEISSFDFTHLMESDPAFVLRKEYILPSLFQVLHGLAALNKYYGIVHFDLHLSNVLVTKISTGSFNRWWHYRIGGTDYYIPNQGYIFKIWDFGRANYIDYDNKSDIKIKTSKQFQRFFDFNIEDFEKHLNKTFNKTSFRKYLYSFDVYRFFSAYYEKLIESVSEFSTKTTKSKDLSTSVPTVGISSSSGISKPLNVLTTKQINILPELSILKKIIDTAFNDIMYNMVNTRLRKHVYQGNPANLIKEFFPMYTVSPVDPEKNIINYNQPYIV
jgi:hypothetical protein